MDKKLKEFRRASGMLNSIEMTVDAVKLKTRKNELAEIEKRIKLVTQDHKDCGFQMVLAEILAIGMVSNEQAQLCMSQIVTSYKRNIAELEDKIVERVKSV